MNARPTDPAHQERMELAAAEWLVKRDRGFTPGEQDDFSHWLATDPRHGEWLARHQQTWRQFNLLAGWRPEHSTEPNPDLLARPPQARRRVVAAACALAAALALAALTVPRWRVGPGTGAPAATVAHPPAQAYERRVLEDGSLVELNRGAAVDVRFTAAERRVFLLSGEAYFTVTKNPARPFLVQAAAVGVRAVGTAFNVRLEPAAVEVLVTEGRVAVTPPVSKNESPGTAPGGELPQLIAGQRAVVPLAPGAAAPAIQAVSPQDMARLLAWQPQLLDFSSTPLTEVVAEFNRRNRIQLVIASPELGSVPIVASFRSDSIDAFVRLLEITAGVRAERRGENEIVLHQAAVAR